MAHQDSMRGDAFAGEDRDLLEAAARLVRMGDDRAPDFPRRSARGRHELSLVAADFGSARGDLDEAGADAGAADPFGELLYIDGRDLVDRQRAERIRQALVLLVRARGADDAHSRALR